MSSDDVDAPVRVPAFVSDFPPHARIVMLHFDPDGTTLGVTLQDAEEATVDASSVRSLHGAFIHFEDHGAPVRFLPDPGSVVDPGSLSSMPTLEPSHHGVQTDEWSPVIAMRVEGVAEIWYIHADSFNYKQALGKEAGLAGKVNFKLLVHHLADSCPQATRDPGFEAMLAQGLQAHSAGLQATLKDFFHGLALR